MADTAEHSKHQIVGHEHSEADVRIIIETVIGLILSVAVVCLIVWGVFNVFKVQIDKSGTRVSGMAAPPFLPPPPRLEVQPFLELRGLRAHEDDVLNHYRWVDQSKGIVHIPIEKAIDEVVGQLPQRPSAPGGQNAARR